NGVRWGPRGRHSRPCPMPCGRHLRKTGANAILKRRHAMSETLPQRPTFSNGQYIGANDLNATVDYARDESERLALSGRTWGIATGLALVEITDATGAIQMYIEPGIAWDGYGRPIVVVTPAPVTAEMFADLGSGNQMVWLQYRAVDMQMIAPGFQTCGAGDPATRIAETYAIVTGAQSS